MRKVILAALLMGTAATPALAQDGTFTGPRVEGIVGYDALKSGDREGDGVNTSEDEGDETIDGVAYGLGVGYDFDFGGIVAGIEGEYVDSTGKQEIGESVDAPIGSRIETGRDIYVGGRLGVRAAPSTLVYAKAGYTNLRLEGGFVDGVNKLDFDSKAEGYRLGAGVEQLFGPNMYGKVEYRYSNYNNLNFNDQFAGNDDIDIDLDRHQVVAGIGVRF